MDLAADVASTTDILSLTDPKILGPVAAFIFAIFVLEVVVSGKAYKREVDEKTRIRAQLEASLPIMEELVSTNKKLVEKLNELAETTDLVVDILSEEDPESLRKIRRRRKQQQ